MTIPTPLEVFNYDLTLWDRDKHLDGFASFAFTGKNGTFAGEEFRNLFYI